MKEDYSKYSKEELLDIMEYLDTEITNLDQIVVKICEVLSCDNCPVVLLNEDKRTKNEMEYVLCCSQLYNWIIKEAKKLQKNKNINYRLRCLLLLKMNKRKTE